MISQHLGWTAAATVSLAAMVATYPFSAAATTSRVTTAAAAASSLYSVPFSSSPPSFAASSSSASSASQRPAEASAKVGAPEAHAPLTAAAQARDSLQSRQQWQAPLQEQQQKRSLSLDGYLKRQQQQRLQTLKAQHHLEQRQHPLRAEHVEQQHVGEKKQLQQLSDEHQATDGGLFIRSASRLANISLRQQQQQHEENVKDEDSSSRVRISSRSLYAPGKSLLHMTAASAGPRLWRNEEEDEAAGRAEGATGGAATARKTDAAGDNSRSRAAGAQAKTAEEDSQNTKPLLNSSSSSTGARGDRKAAAASYVATQQRVQQRRQQGPEQLPEKQQRDDDSPSPRQGRGAGVPQHRDVPTAEARIALLQQNQWREGVDNKRFPCVMRGKRTEGSTMRHVSGVRTEHKCQRLCRREKNCTHAILNTADNSCSLKSGVIDPVDGADEEIVIPYNCADCWHVNSGISGTPFLNRTLYSPFGCLTYCQSQPRCHWWQYSVYEEKCMLFSDVSEEDVQENQSGQVAGRGAWCDLTPAELHELASPEEGEANLGSGWIKSQCMQPPHTRSIGVAFEQFSNLRTADMCQKECQKRALCRYFDFNRTGTICRLFDKGGYQVATGENYVAGPRTCNMSCFLIGRKLRHGEAEGGTEDSWEVKSETTMECQVRCNENARCKRFSYCTESGQCILSKIGPPRTTTGAGSRVVAEEENEGEESTGEEETPEQELSYRTKEATGCYVGPAAFCTPAMG